MGKNICKWCKLQGITFQNIETSHTAQYKKKKKSEKKKMVRRPKQTFLLRRHTDGQQAHEMMLEIASY